ncbi:hypothetical protein BDW74DRAFT_123643 [Aspergillus multicolor]|uniref:uncharacterized protein n=1 Tax=Aspergillus multicolor TaxID=41759 RepID=UPI003CCCB66F
MFVTSLPPSTHAYSNLATAKHKTYVLYSSQNAKVADIYVSTNELRPTLQRRFERFILSKATDRYFKKGIGSRSLYTASGVGVGYLPTGLLPYVPTAACTP